jgi:AbrB family looped-hinge helix DNA binding protein
MNEMLSSVSPKGQVTIPAEIRRLLGVKTKDKVAFVVGPEGTVELRVPRYSTVASVAGAAGTLPHPLSWEQMREIAREDHLQAITKRDDA